MTSQIITQGMSAADLDKLDLIADIQFNEPLGSAAINRKFFGVMPEGIYRGFKAAPAGGLTVVVGQDSVNVAVVNVDGFMINVHSLRPIVLDIPVGREVYAIIEANYAIGRRTTQTDINASIKAADLRIINPNELRKNHVIVFTANLPEGTTEIKPEHILTEKRQNASILDDVTDELRKVIYGILETISKKDPFPQYATKDSPALTGKPTSPTPTTDAKGDEIATAKFVLSSIAALVGAAPDVMDTLQEISAALNNNPNFANEIIFQLSGKLSKDECGADIPDKAKFLENLGIKELLEELKKNSGAPILSRDWVPLRTAMWKGYAAADGQLIENGRALYPDAWAAIEAGLVPVCTEAEWLGNPSKRGCYTVGDGKTNFRVPDYNGKSAGALGAVVFRGDGKNAAPAGDVQGDAIREIQGEWASGAWEETVAKGGAFDGGSSIKSNYHQNAGLDSGHNTGFNFKASRVVPTAEENRMVNVAGCWAIRLFGAVQNTGSADAAALATAIAKLSKRVEEVERPVLSRDWVSLRTAMWTGYTAADGQIVENGRALFPDAWAAIQAGLVPVCSEADWLANPSKRGCYTTGDGETNFRVPDYNGKSDGALGAVVFRGDGKNAAAAGDVQGDAARPIKSSIGSVYVAELRQTGKALKLTPYGNSPAKVGTIGGDPGANYTIEFDTSKGDAPTAEENRMVNVAGCWAIRLFGAVQNTGSADAAALATAIAGLSKRIEEVSKPVLSRDWVSLRTAMWTGYTAADGQIVENGRALYPDAWAAIEAGLVPVCSEADWLANPSKRGCYTVGDGKTNFRVPDYNGKSDGALGAVVFRGDGKNAAPAGDVQGDATRKIFGQIAASWEGDHAVIGTVSGAFHSVSACAKGDVPAYAGGGNATSVAGFDSSRVVPTAPENRMVNVAGCWVIRLFGAVQNTGSVDAAELATAIASLSSRVAALEARKSTCLVNAVGTGAPHETVVAQIPANISKNSKYIIPNPFGNNVPVQCKAEIFVNGEWGETGWIYTNSALGYGVRAVYSQGNGIVVITGCGYLASAENDGGNNLNIQSATTSAPCRVFIRKLEA